MIRICRFLWPGPHGYSYQSGKCPKLPSVNHAVTHEVHAPALVDLFLFYQRLFNPTWQSTLSFAFSVQLQEFIHPINFFMVPFITKSSDIGKEFPESIGGVFKRQILQRFNYCCVILLSFVVIHLAWQWSQFTGTAHKNVAILYNGLRQFPLLVGP